MDFMELLAARRSTRRFSDTQITEDALEAVLLAANNAPVGSNLYRDLHLSVVQSNEVLEQLAEAARQRSEDKARVKQITAEMAQDQVPSARVYDPYYGAPTVIFVSHRKQDMQPGIEYSNVTCITMCMQLAATELGLGSVFLWFVLEAMRDLPHLDRAALLNLPDDFEPLLGLALGYPAKPIAPRMLKNQRIATDYLRIP